MGGAHYIGLRLKRRTYVMLLFYFAAKEHPGKFPTCLISRLFREGVGLGELPGIDCLHMHQSICRSMIS